MRSGQQARHATIESMTSRRGGRPSQVRPRPPSTGRPAPAKVRPRPPAAGRVASHRRVERTRRLALPFRLLFAVAVVALGAGALFVANGGVGRAAAFLGSTLAGFAANLSATPAPSAAPLVAASAPVLVSPEEPYTNQPTVDLAGRVPENLVGLQGYAIRIYVALGNQPPGEVAEIAMGDQVTFVIASVALSEGTNTFTATIAGPAGESSPSPGVAYVLDTAKPAIKISAPRDGGVVNAKSVEVKGKTQARSGIELMNATTGASVTGAADVSGAFSLIVPIDAGVNQLTLTATDPAGNANTSTLSVRKGSGALTAKLTASVNSIRASKLPQQVQVSLVVRDPDGQPVAGAQATFSLAAPNVPIISKSIQTDGAGGAVFTTTIPNGATRGQCKVTVVVHTADFGDTTGLAIIMITR
jgi:hypothetical protein